MGKLTYLKKISKEKGWGIFALEPLPAFIYVGEYTGRVIKEGDASIEPEAVSYLFGLHDDNHLIDPFRQGSACRLINHSCDPNVVATLIIHEALPKIIFITRRTIKADEELTIDYGWEFEEEESLKVKLN